VGMVPFCINHCLFKLGTTNSDIKLWQQWHSDWYVQFYYEGTTALKLSCSDEPAKMMNNFWEVAHLVFKWAQNHVCIQQIILLLPAWLSLSLCLPLHTLLTATW
jgi:hypothetical protein